VIVILPDVTERETRCVVGSNPSLGARGKCFQDIPPVEMTAGFSYFGVECVCKSAGVTAMRTSCLGP